MLTQLMLLSSILADLALGGLAYKTAKALVEIVSKLDARVTALEKVKKEDE